MALSCLRWLLGSMSLPCITTWVWCSYRTSCPWRIQEVEFGGDGGPWADLWCWSVWPVEMTEVKHSWWIQFMIYAGNLYQPSWNTRNFFTFNFLNQEISCFTECWVLFLGSAIFWRLELRKSGDISLSQDEIDDIDLKLSQARTVAFVSLVFCDSWHGVEWVMGLLKFRVACTGEMIGEIFVIVIQSSNVLWSSMAV